MRQRIFLNSVPKAGAHLVEKALHLAGCPRGARPLGSETLIGRREWVKRLLREEHAPGGGIVLGLEIEARVRRRWVEKRLANMAAGTYLRGHVRHTDAFSDLLETHGFARIQVARDPRDVAVSHAHYVSQRKRHPFHAHYVGLPDLGSRIRFSISGGAMPGIGTLESLSSRYRGMQPWIEDPGSLTLRFEDLVGSAGGGSDEAQASAIGSLVDFLRIELTDEGLAHIVQDLFGGTSTFRQGRIGSWRSAFDAACHKEYGQQDPGPLAGWAWSAAATT